LILIRIFPVLWATLPKVIWVVVGMILLIRFISYGLAAFKYHLFASVHTYLNKFTGLMVFGVVYAIGSPIAVPYCWLVCLVAMLGSLEELFIHVTSKEYDHTRKTIFRKETVQESSGAKAA
jgi:CDP-diacylglycerol--glycerol-3-phosphate 3-phosphatidyltransferase